MFKLCVMLVETIRVQTKAFYRQAPLVLVASFWIDSTLHRAKAAHPSNLTFSYVSPPPFAHRSKVKVTLRGVLFNCQLV